MKALVLGTLTSKYTSVKSNIEAWKVKPAAWEGCLFLEEEPGKSQECLSLKEDINVPWEIKLSSTESKLIHPCCGQFPSREVSGRSSPRLTKSLGHSVCTNTGILP